jgi:malonyl-CoA decarboxylase
MLGIGWTKNGLERSTKVARLIGQCARLLSHRGHAVSHQLAREVLDGYAELDTPQRTEFFIALLDDFSPDPQQALQAAQRYAEAPSAERLAELHGMVEPPRQELLRRLNRTPGGMKTVLRMRGDLLRLLRSRSDLAAVDWDFHHLLASWFNPGFLQVHRIDWRSPAYLLERIIEHDAVHEIRDWHDLRRRLESDRRCFAFFHPVLPDEPLIFVEVALLDDMPASVAPLVGDEAVRGDAERARVATLYSINNTQPGLRGVSLGNFLVKQVVELLSAELPRLRRFCTLSPVPQFVPWLTARLSEPGLERPAAFQRALDAVTGALGTDPLRFPDDPEAAMAVLSPLQKPLLSLCATFLLSASANGDTQTDPVARFHLNNGARLDRINWGADLSKRGLQQSLAMMVNYVYEPAAIDRNHERFLQGRVMASSSVTSLALD